MTKRPNKTTRRGPSVLTRVGSGRATANPDANLGRPPHRASRCGRCRSGRGTGISSQRRIYVPDTAGLLPEIRRVLVTGGRLLVTTPSHDLPRRALIALLRWEPHFDPLGQHVRFYTRRSLSRVLETFAFEDVRVQAQRGTLVARARKARVV